MECNFKCNSPYSYLKYGGYNGQYKGKEYYMVPNPQSAINIRDSYDIFNKIEDALVDLLNIGRMSEEDDDELAKFTFALYFVEQYGLLGFMAEAPINPNFMIYKEVVLKEGNFIDKNCVIKTSDYFELFFPFATKEDISYSVENNQVTINTNSELQKLLSNTTIKNQLIYSSFYCEKIDWIIAYARKMYNVYKKITDFSDFNSNSYDKEKAKEIINNYAISGVPYRIHMVGNKPEIAWQPNSLKQALDMCFGFMMCNEKNPIKQCKYCGKIFLATNPKAEYCSSQCRNKSNVYKSREKNKN